MAIAILPGTVEDFVHDRASLKGHPRGDCCLVRGDRLPRAAGFARALASRRRGGDDWHSPDGAGDRRGAEARGQGRPGWRSQTASGDRGRRGVPVGRGAVEITDIRRQREEWQRSATRQLATGRTEQALETYERRGHVYAAETREGARAALIEGWDRERIADPGASRIILTHMNDEVQVLNGLARGRLRNRGELKEDVAVKTERGEKSFAAGDRIMFLRNERSLGVKNGTVGMVERMGAARMAVLLDDGRAIAFDVKDYAAVDYGYAATVHKSQGVTVDRVHVLATPGLDRHAAYVALSRHRDGVELHYGKDDFAGSGELVEALSRERSKDMASDHIREFGDRRAIIMASAPAAVRNEFADLFLPPVRPPASRAPSLEEAVVRVAKATAEIVRVREQGLKESPAQADSFKSAARALDEMRPGAAHDLREAFVRNMQLIGEAADGDGRSAVRAMDWEQRYRTDPRFRADHFVKVWRQLGDRHEALERRGEDGAANRLRAQMTGLAKSLERDPQVESILRSRTKELRMPAFMDRPLSEALPDWIGCGRGRGLGR